MSGSGGYFKYRCKYFYTHNCPNWVYVNNSPCPNCCAEGRDFEQPAGASAPAWTSSRDIFVPRIEDGIMRYTLMEIVGTGEAGNYWSLRYKVEQPAVPTVATTSATPRPAVLAPGH